MSCCLQALGAVSPDGTYDYALTVAGNSSRPTTIGLLAGSREPERAKATASDTRLNPCSGKWNHIIMPRHAATALQSAVDYFFIELDRYL